MYFLLAYNSKYLFAGTAGINKTMPDTGVAFVTPFGGDSWQTINNGFVRNGAHLEGVSAMCANDFVVFAEWMTSELSVPLIMDKSGTSFEFKSQRRCSFDTNCRKACVLWYFIWWDFQFGRQRYFLLCQQHRFKLSEHIHSLFGQTFCGIR